MRMICGTTGRLSIAVVVALVLILALGVVAFTFSKFGEKLNAGGDEADRGERVKLFEWKLDEFIVNLADPDEPRYLKVTMVLEVEVKGTAGEAENPEEARARDAIITVLTRKCFDDLISDHGKANLKSELKFALNDVLDQTEVANIYFTSFAMQ